MDAWVPWGCELEGLEPVVLKQLRSCTRYDYKNKTGALSVVGYPNQDHNP